MLKNLLNKGGHTTTRIFLNPCPKLRIFTRNESVEEKNIHEPDPQKEHLEVFLNHPCKHIEDSWITSDGEKTLEPEIEEFLACLSPDPLCIQECNKKISKDLHGMTKEDMQTIANEQESQGNKDYIETWFQTIISHNIPPLFNISWHHINQSSWFLISWHL
jgi:hypothetical protein